MCQYSCDDGFATDWHFVHLGSRAVGGAGLVIAEATAVEARGRISPRDLGIWKDEHIEPLARIASFIRRPGAAAGFQLAHAGRKASTRPPWDQHGARISIEDGGWTPVAPSPVPFRDDDTPPHELTRTDIREIIEAFAAAAARAVRAGFDIIEIHAAHGYLIHEFLSPLANYRRDEYGGNFRNRIRFAEQVTQSVRAAIPESMPLFVRISASDWVEGGWNLDESVELARCLKPLGADLIDCSSGGMVPHAKIELGPGYQVPFAERIRREAAIPAAAVGLITEPHQAEEIIAAEKADLVMLAREMLRDPYWPLRAARALGAKPPVPVQYERAW